MMSVLGEYLETGMIRRADGACVPVDPLNRDYVDLMARVAAGDTIAAYVPPPPPPPEAPVLQPYQFFAMLEISGKKAVLDAFIDALPAPQNIVARAKLDRSLAFHRDNDLVLAAQQALGLTDAEIDALWTQAASL